MHTVPISFCAGTAHHITDDSVKEELLRDISDRMRVRTMMREAKVFRPGAGQDTAGSYVTHLQSRGNPYVLFLTRIGFAETSLYVDRKVRPGHTLPRVIVDHIMFSQDLYDGTILSGEMVRTVDGDWRFLAEDLLAVRGKPLGRVCYRDRYAALLQVVASSETDAASTHKIAVKKVFSANDNGFDEMQKHAASVPYGCTGCIYRSLVPGKSNWFVKGLESTLTDQEQVSDRKLMTIKSTVTPDVYEVYDESGDKKGVLGVQGIDLSLELSKAFGSGAGTSIKWKCKWSEDFEKWVAIQGGGSQ